MVQDYESYGQVSPTEIEQYLRDVDFPADKKQIVAVVTDSGASQEVLSLLHTLPEQEYADEIAVVESIGTGGLYENNPREERNPEEERHREG